MSHTLQLCDADDRPVAFVTITGTDLDDGATELVADAISDATADSAFEVTER